MKKTIALLLALAVSISMLAGCSTKAAEPETQEPAAQESAAEEPAAEEPAEEAAAPVETEPEATVSAPKYVFLFIGDGMSYPRFQATSDYLGALADDDYMLAEPSLEDNQGAVLDGPEALNFMNFAVAGSAVTYDSNSFAPDSASMATSIARYDSDYVAAYKENQTDFDTVFADIETLFGLKTEGEEGDKLVLTGYELSQLKTAYEKSIQEQETGVDPQQEYVMYGTYEPLTVTITHILNNKSGVSFTSYSHTGLPVAVFADGVHAEDFKGYFDNTEIYNKLAAMLGVQ